MHFNYNNNQIWQHPVVSLFKITSPMDDASVESSEPKKDDQEKKEQVMR